MVNSPVDVFAKLRCTPNANLTVDRFHVTKMIHQELNQAIIDQKKASSSLKVKERAWGVTTSLKPILCKD
jgi:transposase